MSEWIQNNHEGPYKRVAGKNMRTESEIRIRERYEHATLLALNMEEVAIEGPWPLEARKEKFSARASTGNAALSIL